MLSYLDPASGSMLAPLIAGGVAGIAVVFKTFRYRIKSMLGFGSSKTDEIVDDAAETPSS